MESKSSAKKQGIVRVRCPHSHLLSAEGSFPDENRMIRDVRYLLGKGWLIVSSASVSQSRWPSIMDAFPTSPHTIQKSSTVLISCGELSRRFRMRLRPSRKYQSHNMLMQKCRQNHHHKKISSLHGYRPNNAPNSLVRCHFSTYLSWIRSLVIVLDSKSPKKLMWRSILLKQSLRTWKLNLCLFHRLKKKLLRNQTFLIKHWIRVANRHEVANVWTPYSVSTGR